MEMSKFYCCKECVRNNYQSRNLIGHYPFWVISPRNSTSFTRPFLAGRRAWAGHETKCVPSLVLTRLVCTMRSFSAPGTRLTKTLKKRFPCLISGARISDLLSKYGKASSIASEFGDARSCSVRKNLKYLFCTMAL